MEAVDRRTDVNHQPAAVLLCQQSTSAAGAGRRTVSTGMGERTSKHLLGQGDASTRPPAELTAHTPPVADSLGGSLNTADNALDPRLTRLACHRLTTCTPALAECIDSPLNTADHALDRGANHPARNRCRGIGTRDLAPLARDPLDGPGSVISRSLLERAAIVRDFDDRVDGPDAVCRSRRLGDGACRSQLHILCGQQYHPRPPYPLSADRFRHDPWSPDVTHAVRTPTLSPPTQMAPQRWLYTIGICRRSGTFALRGHRNDGSARNRGSSVTGR